MKHALLDLYWKYYQEPEESAELLNTELELCDGIDEEMGKKLLKMIDLHDEHLDQATLMAFELGFKLAASLASELTQEPHLFLTESHLTMVSVQKE